MIQASRSQALAAVLLVATACSSGGGDATTQGTNDFSIAGTARAAAATAVDGDTWDPRAPPTQNDDFASAQQLPSAVTVGGYAGVLVDPQHPAPDPDDYYRAALAAGQVVSLSIADPGADLDLGLYSDPTTLVTASDGAAAVESVRVVTAGEYFIRVLASTGASNYVLTLGAAAPVGAGADALDESAEFVPGEAIVRFRDGGLAAAAAETVEARAASLGLVARAGGPGREMLMELGPGASRAQALAALGADDAPGPPIVDALEQERRDTVRLVKALRGRPDVASADLNYIRYAARVPNDQHYGFQWHYPLMKLPQAWDVTTGSSSVIVAVVDTGILGSHPDLAGKSVDGYDFISSAANARDGNGIDPDPTDAGDSEAGQSSFHGSHVAGTIAATTDNGTGVAGVSWGARIMPLRVLGLGGGTSFDIIQAVRYAAGLSNASSIVLPPERRAQVINLSLGGPGNSIAEQAVYGEVRAQGVVVVAAAGNNNSGTAFYPASYAGVISVSAVDLGLSKAPYSNFGPNVDVAAPGGNVTADKDGNGFGDGVLSTSGDDSTGPVTFNYSFLQGTSMASPHVAGVIALMKAVCPSMGPAQVDALIDGTSQGGITVDLGTPGRDDIFGHGFLDALAAVQKAQGGCGGGTPPPVTTLDVSPTRLDFAPSATSATLTVAQSGPDPLGAVTTSVDGAWLSVAQTPPSGDGLGTYTVTVDRAAVGNQIGAYSGKVTFTVGAISVGVPVTMQIGGAAAGAGDAGHIYLLLLNANLDVIAQLERSAGLDGAYAYAFHNLAAAPFYVVAGSDSDDDGFICDAGESCGAYPTLGLPSPISSSDRPTGIDFAVGFDLSLSNSLGAGAPLVPPEGLRLPRPSKRVEVRP